MTDNTEKSMPLKEKFNAIVHNFPRNEKHNSPCRAMVEALVLIRRQKGAKGGHRPQSLFGLHGKVGQGG